MSRDLRTALGGKEERGENPEKRGFASAVGAEQGQRFAGPHLERNSRERDNAGLLEGLQKGAPSAARGRKRLLELGDGNRGFGHDRNL